jgi:hypothetical protein
MNDQAAFILSLSIIFSVIIGIIRFNKMDKRYYPFIFYICVVLITELAVKFFIDQRKEWGHWIMPWMNCYALLEFCLLLWFFNQLGLANRNSRNLYFLLGGAVLSWTVMVLFYKGLQNQAQLFYIFYSFVLVFASVYLLNKIIVYEKRSLLRNAEFLICLGVIIFFTFFILYWATNISLFGVIRGSASFQRNVGSIKNITNFFVNLLYAVAILWIPTKTKFTRVF